MSILDAMPHRATAYLRVTEGDVYGGSRSRTDPVFSNRACWQQAASEGEVNEFAKRGITVTSKIYFTSAVAVDERHVLVVTNTLSSSVVTFDVVSRAVPDASAGKGVVWRVMLNARTDEGTAI